MEVKSEPEDYYTFAQTSETVSTQSAHDPTICIKTEVSNTETTSLLFNQDEKQSSVIFIKQEGWQSNHENVSTVNENLSETVTKCDAINKRKRYFCNLCKYTTDRRQSFFVHSKNHKKLNHNLRCNKCEFLTDVSTGVMIYKCESCKPMNKTPKNVESKEKFFYCNSCGFKAAGMFNFQTLHEFVCHKVEKPFTCPSCDYKCVTQSALTDHLVTHIGDNPFPCSICRYRTNSKENLEAHILTHKPFLCTTCKYRCATQATLNMHLRTHNKTKDLFEVLPYFCTTCDYRCSTQTALNMHLRTHRTKTQQKPFFCTVCDCKCATRTALKLHLKSHKRKDHLKNLAEKKIFKVYDLDRLQTVKMEEVCINKDF